MSKENVNVVKDKSFEFALKIIDLYKYLHYEKKEYVIKAIFNYEF